MPNHFLQIKKWLKQLDELRHKNAVFKIMLSEMVDKSVLSDFLLKAETMHNELIANDESIELLTDSANYLMSKLNGESNDAGKYLTDKRIQLSYDIQSLLNRFEQLEQTFEKEYH